MCDNIQACTKLSDMYIPHSLCSQLIFPSLPSPLQEPGSDEKLGVQCRQCRVPWVFEPSPVPPPPQGLVVLGPWVMSALIITVTSLAFMVAVLWYLVFYPSEFKFHAWGSFCGHTIAAVTLGCCKQLFHVLVPESFDPTAARGDRVWDVSDMGGRISSSRPARNPPLTPSPRLLLHCRPPPPLPPPPEPLLQPQLNVLPPQPSPLHPLHRLSPLLLQLQPVPA